MYYTYDIAVVSLLFLIVIAFHFFSKRQFPSKRTRLFKCTLLLALIDTIFDITSSLVIELVAKLPVWLTILNNSIFYAVQIAFPAIAYLFFVTLTGSWNDPRCRWRLVLLPALLMEGMLIVNLFTGWVFCVDGAAGYVRGPTFIMLYVGALFYLLAALTHMLRYRRKVKRVEFWTTLTFMLINVASVVIQYFVPHLLIVGTGVALSVTMMYLIMQKPENMLDVITGAFTREAFVTYLSDRYEDRRPHWIIAVDMHNMRRINRIFGLTYGNAVIARMADIMRDAAPRGWVFRFISNIFVLICEDEEAFVCAKTYIARQLAMPHLINQVEQYIVCTTCYIPQDMTDHPPDEMAEILEAALSGIPHGGSDTLREDAIARIARAAKVENALIAEVERKGFDVYLQPVRNCATGRYDMAEALVRFNHPQLGGISPTEFIPIAEKQGLIGRIDAIVLERVCAFIRRNDPLHSLGLDTVQLNLSPVEFMNENLVEQVVRTVEAYGVAPEHIVFEITEGTAVSEFNALSTNVERLCAKGFRFALDDYGTGYSNISILMRLPFHIVKVDKSMLKTSMLTRSSHTMLRGMLQIFRDLGVRTMVEGVETEEEIASIADCPVDYIQGYYFAKPMSLTRCEAFLRDRLPGGAHAGV